MEEAYHDEQYNVDNRTDAIGYLVSNLMTRYLYSDVCSGEFILGERFPFRDALFNYEPADVKKAVQMFLDWDESPQEFTVVKAGRYWVIKEA